MTTNKTLQDIKNTVLNLFRGYGIKEVTYKILLNEDIDSYDYDKDIIGLEDKDGKRFMLGELFYINNILLGRDADLSLVVNIDGLPSNILEGRPRCDTDWHRSDDYRDLDDDDAEDYDYIESIVDNYIEVGEVRLNDLLIDNVGKNVTLQFISLTNELTYD